MLTDSSVRFVWTYLTASPCYTTNTNKYDYTIKDMIKMNTQFINAVSETETEYIMKLLS